MRILVYKRTHTGDPNSDGVFGGRDCMGSVRSWRYDAVIGVGGIGAEPASHGISGLVTWIGIGPHRAESRYPARGPLVTFDTFELYDQAGTRLDAICPRLARRLFGGQARVLVIKPEHPEHQEALDLLAQVRGRDSAAGARRIHRASGAQCSPRRCVKRGGPAPKRRCPPMPVSTCG
jgi:hypothetical protein